MKKVVFDFEKEKNPIDRIAVMFLQDNYINRELKKLVNNDNKNKYLGKILVYENIIAYKLSYLIRARQEKINSEISLKRFKIKKDNPLILMKENKTLGELIGIYRNLLSTETSLLKKMSRFNTERNVLTHFMHLGFDSSSSIRKKAKSICLLSEKLIIELEKERKNLQIPFNIKIPKIIKVSDLMEFGKQRSEAVFSNPDDIIGNLKKF
jgi:hypothetical protein